MFPNEKTCFQKIKTRQELAEILEIPLNKMTYYAYSKNSFYTEFTIKKRDGKANRVILAPKKGLKIIQKKIASFISEIYDQYIPTSAQGFISQRSIVTNAEKHVRKKYILKVDLKDFFPSINAGRVHRLFRSKPFYFSPEVADCLTRLVCVHGCLPQGSPASPVISNMICWKMDRTFMNYCKDKKILYSRYADDLTFSTNCKKSLPFLVKDNYEKNSIILTSDDISSIIKKNYFVINKKKTGLFSNSVRQSVTGVIVNKKLNFRRKEYEQLRNLFWYWKKVNSTELAAERYVKYFFPGNTDKFYDDNGEFVEEWFIRHIRGRLDFFSMICEKNKSIESTSLERLWTWYYEHTNRPVPKISIERRVVSTDLLLTINGETADQSGVGTGCFIEGLGFVTACHCIFPIRKDISMNDISEYVFTIDYEGKTLFEIKSKKELNYYIKEEIIRFDKELDCARIIIPKNCLPQNIPFYLSMDSDFQINNEQKVKACGFADGLSVHKTVHAKIRNIERNNVQVDTAFVSGMSGGPVLNNAGRIIGIVTKGSNNGNYWKYGELIRIDRIVEALKKSTTN